MKVSDGYWLAIGFLAIILPAVSKAVIVTHDVPAPCSRVVAYKGLVYFCAEHPLAGREVHVSNGDQFGTRVLKDIDLGSGDSSPIGFFEHKGFLFFIAETANTGYALWKTDGTEAGTKFVKSLGPHSRFEQRKIFSIVARSSDDVYFQFSDVLFRTNGTFSGTAEIDVPITFSPTYDSTYFLLSEQLFVLTDSILYKVNSDTSSTVIATLPSFAAITSFIHSRLKEFNGKFIITATSPVPSGGYRQELWISDGTTVGTKLFRPDNYLPVGVVGNKLLMVNPFGTMLVSTTNGDDENSVASGVIFRGTQGEYNGMLLVNVRDEMSGFDTKSLITDGSSTGTMILPMTPFQQPDFDTFTSLVNSPGGSTDIGYVLPGFSTVELNGLLLGVGSTSRFSAPSSLFVSNGTPDGTEIILTDNSSHTIRFAGKTSEGAVFIRGVGDMWITDGTKIGTRRFSNTGQILNYPFWVEGNKVYFNGSNNSRPGQALWHADGTPAGAYALKYRFEDGSPEPETVPKPIIVPIIQLLLDE